MRIGIFDSGVGGLTVLKEIDKNLKGIEFFYLADSKRAPYGNRTVDEIKQFTLEIVNFLKTKKVDKIVIACNTVNSVALDVIYQNFEKENVIGIIDAGVNSLKNIDKKNILVLATKATVNSHKYKENIIKYYSDKFNILEHACVNFVSLIENDANEDEINKDIQKELNNIINDYDAIILACTHFPLIESNIKNIYSNKTLINPAKYIINSLNIENENNIQENKYHFFTTGDIKSFKEKSSKILNKETENIISIKI